jgi:hypothetical protein
MEDSLSLPQDVWVVMVVALWAVVAPPRSHDPTGAELLHVVDEEEMICGSTNLNSCRDADRRR